MSRFTYYDGSDGKGERIEFVFDNTNYDPDDASTKPVVDIIYGKDADGNGEIDYLESTVDVVYKTVDSYGNESTQSFPYTTLTKEDGKSDVFAIDSTVKGIPTTAPYSANFTGASSWVYYQQKTEAHYTNDTFFTYSKTGGSESISFVHSRAAMPKTIVIYFAEDANGNGIPDAEEDRVIIKFVQVSADGNTETEMTADEIDDLLAGQIPSNGELLLSDYSGKYLSGYIFDSEKTKANLDTNEFTYNAATGKITFTYHTRQSGRVITLYYGADGDGNGLIDYLQDVIKVKYVKVDGNAAQTAPADYTTPWTEGGQEGYPNGSFAIDAAAKNTFKNTSVQDANGNYPNNYIYYQVYTKNGVQAQTNSNGTYFSFTAGASDKVSNIVWKHDSGRTVVVYYALDANNNGEPDFMEENIDAQYSLIDGNGNPVATDVFWKQYTGQVDSSGSWPVRNMLSADGKGHLMVNGTKYTDSNGRAYAYYVVGTQTSITGLGDANLTFSPSASNRYNDTVRIKYQTAGASNRSFTIVFGVDANNDGVPDILEEKIEVWYQLVDEDGNVVGSQVRLMSVAELSGNAGTAGRFTITPALRGAQYTASYKGKNETFVYWSNGTAAKQAAGFNVTQGSGNDVVTFTFGQRQTPTRRIVLYYGVDLNKNGTPDADEFLWVRYYAYDGEENSIPADYRVRWYSTITIGGPARRGGYTFHGWVNAGYRYFEGDEFTTGASDVTFYADWDGPRDEATSTIDTDGDKTRPPVTPKPASRPPASTTPSTSTSTSTNEQTLSRIADESIPTIPVAEDEIPAQGLGNGAWSLLDLIMGILGLGITIVRFVMTISPTRKRYSSNSGAIWNILAMFSGLVSVVVVLITQRFNNPMVLMDKWTPLVLLLLAVQLIMLLVGRVFRGEVTEDDDDYSQAD